MFINTLEFDVILKKRIPDFIFYSTAALVNVLTTAEQRTGFPFSLRHSSNRTRISLQRTLGH